MNLDQIRAKLQGLNKKTGKRRDLWKPKDKHTVRLLPYPHGDEPFIELGFHYELGDTRSLLCPKHVFGKECAICNFADKLRSWKDEDGVDKPESLRKADFEIFKKIQVRERWYVPMVERLEGGAISEPKFWAFGKTIYEQLLKMCLDEEMNDDCSHDGGTLVLTDPDSAYDVTVDFALPNNKDGKGNQRSFPLTTIKEKKRPSKLLKNKGEIKGLLEKVPKMLEVYPEVSSEEVERIFNAFVGSIGETDDSSDTGTEYAANSAEAPVEGGLSIDEAFAGLVQEQN